jgi:cobalamin biosynthesis protein CbiG
MREGRATSRDTDDELAPKAVVGLGLSSAATAGDVRRSAETALQAAGIGWAEVERIATIAALAPDRRIVSLGYPVVGYEAGQLAAVEGVEASRRSQLAVGTPSVAEAAALLAAGPTGVLVVPKQRSAGVTAAVAMWR